MQLTIESPAVLEAIYKRRAVRDYTSKPVDRETVAMLLKAAIQAPSAQNRQPWAFAVVQDKDRLADYSARAKAFRLETMRPYEAFELQYREMLEDPRFNIFYNAGTLLIIYARSEDPSAAEDCCFAAQNLMLAAYCLGLATCPIGLARPWLDLGLTKRDLRIPHYYKAVLPVVVGYPKKMPAPTERKEPENHGLGLASQRPRLTLSS